MERYFESADVARQVGISPGLVRREAASGKIEVGAVTARGGRLFREEDVRRYLGEREILQFIAGIKEAGERASHIVKNMLEFSRSNNPDHTPINLVGLTDHTLELAESSFRLDTGIEFEKITINKEYADDMPSVNCSGAEVQQVLMNLLRNASQAMNNHHGDGEPTITIKIFTHKAQAVIEHKILPIALDAFGGSALTDDNIQVPENATEGIPITYVPARNTIFLSLALGWAEVIGARDIFVGVNAVDYSGQ